MVIDNLDLFSVGASPGKADAPLVIDADAVLARPDALQRLEPVARREAEEGEFDGSVNQLKFGEGALLDIGGEDGGIG